MESARTRREQEVWQACDDLWASAGLLEKVTGDAIRDRLSNLGFKKGSPNETYKYRRTWRMSRGLREQADPMQAQLQEVDPISRAVALVHEQIKSEARQDAEQMQVQYEGRIETAHKSLAELREAYDLVLKKMNQLEEELAKAGSERNAFEKELAAETKRHELTAAALELTQKQQQEMAAEQARWRSDFMAAQQLALETKDKEIAKLKSESLEIAARAVDDCNQLKIEIRSLEQAKTKAITQAEMYASQAGSYEAEARQFRAVHSRVDLIEIDLVSARAESNTLRKQLSHARRSQIQTQKSRSWPRM